MSTITRKQYEELRDTLSFDKNEFHKLINEYCDIEAKPYTGYSYFDSAGNYIGDSNDITVRDLLSSAHIHIIEET